MSDELFRLPDPDDRAEIQRLRDLYINTIGTATDSIAAVIRDLRSRGAVKAEPEKEGTPQPAELAALWEQVAYLTGKVDSLKADIVAQREINKAMRKWIKSVEAKVPPTKPPARTAKKKGGRR